MLSKIRTMQDNTSYPLHDLLASHRRTFSEKLRFLIMHHRTKQDVTAAPYSSIKSTEHTETVTTASAQSRADNLLQSESNVRHTYLICNILDIMIDIRAICNMLEITNLTFFYGWDHFHASVCLFLATDKVILLIFMFLYTVNQTDDAHKTPSGHQLSHCIIVL